MVGFEEARFLVPNFVKTYKFLCLTTAWARSHGGAFGSSSPPIFCALKDLSWTYNENKILSPQKMYFDPPTQSFKACKSTLPGYIVKLRSPPEPELTVARCVSYHYVCLELSAASCVADWPNCNDVVLTSAQASCPLLTAHWLDLNQSGVRLSCCR